MGIKKLNTFLLKEQLVSVHSNLTQFKNSYSVTPIRICIDTNLYLYKYLYSWGKFKYSFLNQIMVFLTNGIIPVYVFDGSAPKEKSTTLMLRRTKKDKLSEKIQYYESLDSTDEIKSTLENLQRRNISITKNDILSFKYMLDILHVPYYQANGESDVLCAELCKKGIVDMCLSEDLDILTFGCPRLIKIIKEKVYFYSLETILEKLDMSFEKFIIFCTLLGCDYCKPVRNNNITHLLNTTKQSSSLDDIMVCYNVIDTAPYLSAFNIFLNAHQLENVTERPTFDFDKLKFREINNFMIENNFNNWQIKRINSLVKLITA